LVRPALAITCDQASRFAVGAFDEAGVVPVGVEPIEKPCQQDCTGAVDSIKLR